MFQEAASDSDKAPHRRRRYQMLSVPELFNAQRQQTRALIVTQQFTYRPQTGRGKLLCRIDADRQMRAAPTSATGAIAAAAADKDVRPVKFRQMRGTRS